MMDRGVLRSTTQGLTPWRQGDPKRDGLLGIQNDDVLIIGELNRHLKDEELALALRAMAKGLGRGMARTLPPLQPDLFKAFALATPHEPDPIIMEEALVVEPPFPLASYHTVRTKLAHDPATFQAGLGKQLQKAWCQGRRSAGRPMAELAAQVVKDPAMLTAFAGTPLGQTHIIRLDRLFEAQKDGQPNHVACCVLHACTLWSPTVVEDVICDAYEAGQPLSTLRMYQLLEYMDQHPEVSVAPIEFRLLMAFE